MPTGKRGQAPRGKFETVRFQGYKEQAQSHSRMGWGVWGEGLPLPERSRSAGDRVPSAGVLGVAPSPIFLIRSVKSNIGLLLLTR